MKTGGAGPAPRIGLLFTRFPVASETFLQREVEALRLLDPGTRVFALWPSALPGASSSRADHVFNPLALAGLLWWLPYWMVRRPQALTRLAGALLSMRAPNPINVVETLLGLAYAVCRARELSRQVDHLHAVWASAPATAAWAISQLCDIPFSMAGHAYDLYEDGGDGLLELKIPAASFMRSSTGAGCRRWQILGAPPARVHLVRRGLNRFPAFTPDKAPGPVFHLLAVGRLVEKMGYSVLLDLLARLARAGLPFRATLVGDGPMRRHLERQSERLGLRDQLEFTGYLPFEKVQELYAEADLFLFTGRVAASGDRAGFPNAIAEAMAWGVPVCATDVGAVSEGIRNGESGLLMQSMEESTGGICHLLHSSADYQAIRSNARAWVEREFDARRNMQALLALLRRPPEGG